MLEKKLTLSMSLMLLFCLFNVPNINAINIMPYIFGQMPYNFVGSSAPYFMTANGFNNPVVYETSGVDDSGNRYYQKDIIATDYTGDFNELNKILKPNVETLEKNVDVLSELNKLIEEELFSSPIKKNIDMTQVKQENTNDQSTYIPSTVNDYLQPQSAINYFEIQPKKISYTSPFRLNTFNRFYPGLGQFNLVKEKTENFKNLENKNNNIQMANNEINEEIIASDKNDNIKNENQLKNLVDEVKHKEDEYLVALQAKASNLLNNKININQESQAEYVDNKYLYIEVDKKITISEAEDLLNYIAPLINLKYELFKDISVTENLVIFKIESENEIDLNSVVSNIESLKQKILDEKGWNILSCSRSESLKTSSNTSNFSDSALFIIIITASASILCILIGLLAVFIARRRSYLKERLIENINNFGKKSFSDEEKLVKNDEQKSCSSFWCFKSKKNKNQPQQQTSHLDYTDLCRSSKLNQISPFNNTTTTELNSRCDTFNSPITVTTAVNSTPISINVDERKANESSRSSASSWSEEPLSSINMDVKTGHVILSYMEEHLNDKNRLSKEWEDLCNYEAEPNETIVASKEENMNKNRYSNILPYDHNRVKLEENSKNNMNDYINASFITDDDPKNPAYIATQGPLSHTTSDFWQLVWEQNSVIIVSLCRTVEYGSLKCHQYWPINGFETYDNFEVHLVSEHVWCEDYLVRSFYLKNKASNQTRTVTQFHFLTWPENSIPPNVKSILDFRRKVNKSYNRKSSPIIVHCNDGVGRTGTYILIDMILNKIMKEAKEIDLAATLEYLRDQRVEMIKSKNQFEFSFAVVTEEVQNMLKALMD